MKSYIRSFNHHKAGSALILTLVMTGAALAILAGALAWSATNTKQTDRSNNYMRALAAAEAGSEYIVGKMTRDFMNGAEIQVITNLSAYQQSVPSSNISSYWNSWRFTDSQGHTNRTYVSVGTSSNYIVLDAPYAGLQGFATMATIIANANEPAALNSPTGAVYQLLELARVPIFQFAMYSSGDMEIGCGQPFAITGRVHANGDLYVEPDTNLTFQSSVTAVGDIDYARDPDDPRTPPVGNPTYNASKTPHVPAMPLPIGTNNSPLAVREILQFPPAAEDPNSPMGRQRYYNQADMIVTVYNSTNVTTNITVTTGRYDNFATFVTNTQWRLFLKQTNSFYDKREDKTVRPIDIDISLFRLWSATNASIRSKIGNKDVSSIYVYDKRALPGTNLSAVRVYNGKLLPSRGLTVSTPSPLYVLGNYNQTNDANLGTTNTSTTLPASFAADAITVLSTNWQDANSFLIDIHATATIMTGTDLSSRTAGDTTINAGFLAGTVDTTTNGYGGGMENFPRFLEDWGASNPFTYNGAMIKMFPSQYATNAWGKDYTYNPPSRNWAYDRNFDDSTKLPPITPGLMRVIRSTWSTVAANKTNAPAITL